MGYFARRTRSECVSALNVSRQNVTNCVKNRRHNPPDWMKAELDYRNEAVEMRKRLLEIEVQERDALSVELQKATLEAEEARAKDES